MVRRLLDLGANPESGTPASSPLRISVESGFTDMVQLLLTYGPDINGFSTSDKSMLRVEEEAGFVEIYINFTTATRIARNRLIFLSALTIHTMEGRLQKCSRILCDTKNSGEIVWAISPLF
ncbi:hypothetical protein QD47_04685 [Paenibacillus terrae]|uniref:Uncharacterized protein n=1 Tax=Paenibacillus terrae TaxID=159743 RepID=A0A0D7X9M7_9BACL|nr:hypothetical protein QD47_04685 [Paenibacillus terrae]